jgi:hypothetical protein
MMLQGNFFSRRGNRSGAGMAAAARLLLQTKQQVVSVLSD